jgi:ABC-2 type transport system ATP-binding protein
MQIEIKDLVKKYINNQVILDSISLNINGMYGLLGPNGAGKTTLMRILSTLIEFNSGNIIYDEYQWDKNLNELRQIIGYLPQHFSMYKDIKIYECLNHFAILKGISNKSERINHVEQILNEVNLSQHKEKKIKELSGGMLRRVGIAQALIGDPKILIIDEPTAGLDIDERIRFRNTLRSIGENRIVIISTHIVEDLESTCDNVGVLNKGKVLAEGSRKDIISFAKGKIWGMKIPIYQLDNLKEQDNIISIHNEGEHYVLKILSSQKPFAEANLIEPNLEDGYLALIRGI